MIEQNNDGLLCSGPCDDFCSPDDGEIINGRFYCFDCQDKEDDETESEE